MQPSAFLYFALCDWYLGFIFLFCVPSVYPKYFIIVLKEGGGNRSRSFRENQGPWAQNVFTSHIFLILGHHSEQFRLIQLPGLL